MFVNWCAADGGRLNVFNVQEVLEELGATSENCTVKENTKQANGLTIETADEALGRKLMAVLEVRDQVIQASDATTANALKCVIKCAAANDSSTEEILEKTRSQGVINVERRKGKRGTLILSMKELVPPTIQLGPLRVPTMVFVPRPMLCRACFCYGHPEKQCRNVPACLRCGREHNLDPAKKCTRRLECRNCKSNHESKWGGCPVWKQECAVKKIMRTENIAGAEARARYKATCKGTYYELTRGTKRDRSNAAQDQPVVEVIVDDDDSDSSGTLEAAAKPIPKSKATSSKNQPKGGPKRKSVNKGSEDDDTPPKKGKGGKKSSANLSLSKTTKAGSQEGASG